MEDALECQRLESQPIVAGGSVGSSSRSKKLLAVLVFFSFSSQFIPIDPYLVPYLISAKHFSNFQITVDIYPISIYAQLLSTVLLPSACSYLSHKVVIFLGSLGMIATYIIAWVGNSLLSMKVMQVTYGFGVSTRLVFSSYIFQLAAEEEYQTMTSLTTSASLLSFMIASELGQFLALKEVSYHNFFIISLISLGLCSTSSLFLPRDQSSTSLFPSSYFREEGWIRLIKETWHGQTLKILSLWSALSYAGFSLVQNYGTNLFDAVNPYSNLNGHILAASQAAGSLGSFFSLYLDKYTLKGRINMPLYILGSLMMSISCVLMAYSSKIWGTYLFYIATCGIYQSLSCLINVQCGKLLGNRQFILFFSLCNIFGLLLETLLQVAVEFSGLPVTAQFLCFSGFFFMATAIFVGFLFIPGPRDHPTV